MEALRSDLNMIAMTRCFHATNCLLLMTATLAVAEPFDPLQPYHGPSVRGVDTSTLSGKVMTGYQGWFNCEGDGAHLGWVHWGRDRNTPPGPGNVKVDLWPDVAEYAPAELYTTDFKQTDGSPAKVFSSYNRATVLRHFQWLRDYGIDGAFIQRFANGLRNDPARHDKDVVLAHAREGANRCGRAYAVMYDLSGLPAGRVADVLADWQRLRERMRMGEDPAYLHHRGKPLVAVWGPRRSPKDVTAPLCTRRGWSGYAGTSRSPRPSIG